jgi:hypothetical protein
VKLPGMKRQVERPLADVGFVEPGDLDEERQGAGQEAFQVAVLLLMRAGFEVAVLEVLSDTAALPWMQKLTRPVSEPRIITAPPRPLPASPSLPDPSGPVGACCRPSCCRCFRQGQLTTT